jgi:hypothetical protein
VRHKNAQALASALLLIGTSAIAASACAADDARLDGNWKLVVLPYGTDEFAIFKLTEKEGKMTASVVDVQQMLGGNKIKAVEWQGGMLTLTVNGPAAGTVFKGRFFKDGPGAGKILGMVNFRGAMYPARLERTAESKVRSLQRSPLMAKLADAQKEKDPKAKIKKLEAALHDNHGSPSSSLLYPAFVSAAQTAGLNADKITEAVRRWIDEARPYGDEWLNEVRLKALRSVASRKGLAKLAVELAQDADKAVRADDVETSATVVGFLAQAAREAGMEELAKASDARHAKLDQKLDDEYHKKVPPFKPTPYVGRKDKKADKVVLMELFTGAQCPPCVAADVAFDALLNTYKSVDFIGLQYHLHIPGPDPLTNSDSLARQKYYGSAVRGTPSTFFNGHGEAAGGGPMAYSHEKYGEYRGIIDKSLEDSKGATIALSATRAGDQIKIVASAQVTKNGGGRKVDGVDAKSNGQDGGNSRQAKDDSKPVLRLALTEESVHFVGGNKLRYHHRVVRALPGSAKGKELTDGSAKTEITFSLAELKGGLEKYLSDFAKDGTFPQPPPDIKLEDLAVVAFVQDDSDKSILHAVSVPVEIVRP